MIAFYVETFLLGIAQFVDAQAKAKSEKKDMLDTRALAGLGGLIGDKKKQVSRYTVCCIFIRKGLFLLGTVVIQTSQSFESNFHLVRKKK